MATTYVIKIKRGNTSTGKLKLSDNDHTRASNRDKVKWSIKQKSNVELITNIEKKPNSPEIFVSQPQPNGSDWIGVINSNNPILTEYEYTIYWKARDNSGPHRYDPKISIKPPDADFKKKLILFLVLFGASSLLLLRKNKK